MPDRGRGKEAARDVRLVRGQKKGFAGHATTAAGRRAAEGNRMIGANVSHFPSQ